MSSEEIDSNSISDRDKPVYERWLKTKGWDMPFWYRDIYLRTDHWETIKRNCYVYFEGHCSLCGSSRVPFHVHHNNYRRLWKERYSDIIYLCARNHREYHSLLQINKKIGLSKYEIKEHNWFALNDTRECIQKTYLFLAYNWVCRYIELTVQTLGHNIKYDVKTMEKAEHDYKLLKKFVRHYVNEKIGEKRGEYII
jgi:hypothetical protein